MSYATIKKVRRPALGDISQDLTPGISPDLVATWAAIKDKLRSSLGEYQFADGSLMTFLGERCPMITAELASTVLQWVAGVGTKMIAAAAAAGRSTSDMTSALNTLKSDTALFNGAASDTFGGRLPLQQSYQFVDDVNRFAINMSAAQWAAFNNGTPTELWDQALNETPGGGALLDIWNSAKIVAQVTGFLTSNIVIVAGLGVAGYLAYRYWKR